MEVTVELTDSDLREIRRITGIRKNGPAIRKLIADALLFKRRIALADKFISGRWGVALKTFELGREHDQRSDTSIADRWKC